jgi:hypothetical protein
MGTEVLSAAVSKPPTKKRFFALIGMTHLALVGFGAASFEWSEHGPVGRVLDYYGLLSGSAYNYGFFAPGISGQLRVLVDLQDTQGHTRTINLETASSHEADLRVGDIFEQFTDAETGDEVDDDRQRFQRSLAGSLALTAFSRYPDSDLVTIRLEHFNPVSMDEFRQGLRSIWKPLYQASFRYSKHEGTSL